MATTRETGRTGAEAAAGLLPDADRFRWLLGLVVPAAIVVAWHLLVATGVFAAHQLPTPLRVVETLYGLSASGELWGHVAITVQRVFLGVLLGASVGVVLGTLTGLSGLAADLLDPLLQSLKNIPSLAWVPLFLLWFGIGEGAKVLLIAVGAFFPVYLNLSTGIGEVSEDLLEVAEVYDLGRIESLRRVVFPAAVPSLLVGIRGGVGLAWMFVVAAELIAASEGIGFLLSDGRVLARPDIIVGSILLFAFLGNLSDLAVKEVKNRVVVR
ncbi:ABC transporter permease [Halorubrum sp. Ib24]|uniref:ABC transporter permease n=1 Tax=unclassified Halorubrum TaxID=2642239 RepID=UPI000B97CE94|nr:MULTISPECIES: ABC transporter permease [unclassified Halorubrum]OYR38892.1 ABC transporter permease [Halorubrum sp. Ib24]OYR48777.1 ABC transporter permease [Halorubrum sp. Eb13]OYR55892.1 ABC transporter permease [Halorubrum sp. Ea1]